MSEFRATSRWSEPPDVGEGVYEMEGSGEENPPVEKYAAHDGCTLLGSLFHASYIRSA